MIRLSIFFVLLPFLSPAQSDILILKKNGAHVRSYTVGMELTMETVYHQWLTGMITNLRNDSLFLDGAPFHYKEIAAISYDRTSLNYAADGTILMAAGVGVFVLGAVNGMVRKDPANLWYTTTGYITGSALLVGGWLLRRAGNKKYYMGHKYTLDYLSLKAPPKIRPGKPSGEEGRDLRDQ
ncbi:MAG: hypothetical protein P4L51_11485 [Puia sp.]|nr:hypothetical protein [Puia sp.]